MKPYSFLFFSLDDTTEEEQFSLSPPSLAMPSCAFRKIWHRFGLRSWRRMTRFAASVRDASVEDRQT